MYKIDSDIEWLSGMYLFTFLCTKGSIQRYFSQGTAVP